MTRKELARAIYDMGTYTISKSEFVKRTLFGIGAVKPLSKPELISWYENLLATA